MTKSNSDLGGSDLNANLTAITHTYITGCNEKYKTVTVVNTLASLMLKYQAELELLEEMQKAFLPGESLGSNLII